MSKRNAEKNDFSPSKKRCAKQDFLPSYSKEYPCIKKGSTPNSARCEICLCEFSIRHGGVFDIKRHCEGTRHKAKGDPDGKGTSSSVTTVPKITGFFTQSQSPDLSVIRAETLFTSFLIEHNIAAAAADHAGKLFREMFPDSKIAKDYSCGRTKTACIVPTLADNALKSAITMIKDTCFVIGTDGSQEDSRRRQMTEF